MNGFNPRPSSFMGVLAWAATEARLKGFPFCPLAGERVGGCAVEWLSRSFDAMSPTHKFDVEVTDLSTGVHTTFSVIRKQRTYQKTGKTTVRYNTPVGNFSTFDEVNDALVQSALAAAGEMQAAPGGDASDSETQGAEMHSDTSTQGESVPVYPALALDNPVTGSVHLPYHVGPFEQPQQRQMQRADGVTDASLRVLGEIKVERARQQAQEGWTPQHDDGHMNGDLASAAAAYALSAAGFSRGRVTPFWPWAPKWWKPTTSRRDLVKAGALIVAEIERLDRLGPLAPDGPHAQSEQQQAQAAAVAGAEAETCTNCDAPRADPRQRCRNCREPVCLQCATYDEDGTLFCPECAAADGGGFDDLGLDL